MIVIVMIMTKLYYYNSDVNASSITHKQKR